MTATLSRPLPWDEQIGPFYTTQKLVDVLGCSRQAITDRVHRPTLPQTSLGERSVVDWLTAGYDVEPVLELSRAATSRWVG